MDLYRKCRRIQSVFHKEKNIYPNIDVYAEIVLNALGILKEFLTPFFASSRICGWTAHILEKYTDSILLSPTSRYFRVYKTKYVLIQDRKKESNKIPEKSIDNLEIKFCLCQEQILLIIRYSCVKKTVFSELTFY